MAGASAGMTVNRSRGRFQIDEPDRTGRVPVHVVGRVVPFPEGAFLGLVPEGGNRFTLSAHNWYSLRLDYIGVAPVGATMQVLVLTTTELTGLRSEDVSYGVYHPLQR